MRRDIKRRKLAEEYAPMRLRLVAMKRNDILPPAIKVHRTDDITSKYDINTQQISL